MNKEQIIQMAREAGFARYMTNSETDWGMFERFAAAIRSATKEEDAKICDEEIASWMRVTTSCEDEVTALQIAAKAIRASK